ncbi:MAG TPA: hypothetical protein VGN42_13410, partial [Pirellulales bacterium]|nr:hypothetical protein [Pirellulales bacterium]
MNRTLAIPTIALAVGCIVAARYVSAQDPPEAPALDKAQEQYQKAEQRAIDAAIGFLKKHQENASDEQTNDRPALRGKLRP